MKDDVAAWNQYRRGTGLADRSPYRWNSCRARTDSPDVIFADDSHACNSAQPR